MSAPASTRQAWLIGASHGMGRELALQLADQGWRLTLSARGEDALHEVARGCAARVLPLDATDRAAVRQAAISVFADCAPELVMLNVGDYQPMVATAFDVDLFERLNRVNYLTAVYLLDAVLPLMRDNGGQILFNVSASAYVGLPQAGPYSAPKAALLNLAESLQPELAALGIRLRVINPGFVDSRLTRRNRFRMPFLLGADDAARRIADELGGRRFEIAFPRRLVWPLKLLRGLPYPLVFALTRRMVSK